MSLFEDLIVTIGQEAAEKLRVAYAGQRVYVPVRNAFVALIGPEAAQALSRRFGGVRFEMPVKRRLCKRREDIRRLHEAHYSSGTIARMLACSRRYVYRVLADARAESSVGCGKSEQ